MHKINIIRQNRIGMYTRRQNIESVNISQKHQLFPLVLHSLSSIKNAAMIRAAITELLIFFILSP